MHKDGEDVRVHSEWSCGVWVLLDPAASSVAKRMLG